MAAAKKKMEEKVPTSLSGPEHEEVMEKDIFHYLCCFQDYPMMKYLINTNERDPLFAADCYVKIVAGHDWPIQAGIVNVKELMFGTTLSAPVFVDVQVSRKLTLISEADYPQYIKKQKRRSKR